MKSRYLLSCPVFLFLLLSSCHKDNPDPTPPTPTKAQLPAATQTGANTFGCKLNGDVWLPYSNTIGFAPLVAGWSNTSKSASVSARYTKDKLTYSIDILFGPITTTGSFTLARRYADSKPQGSYYSPEAIYYTNSTHTGTITITRFDTIASIMSGTFEFTAVDTATGKTITITEGRFDSQFSH